MCIKPISLNYSLTTPRTVTLNDKCEEDEQCASMRAKCEKKKCSCTLGYAEREGRCQPG